MAGRNYYGLAQTARGDENETGPLCCGQGGFETHPYETASPPIFIASICRGFLVAMALFRRY